MFMSQSNQARILLGATSIFYWLRWGLANSLSPPPRLASSCDPPDLCLLSSQDYRYEQPYPVYAFFFGQGLAM
jgi:hypothetical protein